MIDGMYQNYLNIKNDTLYELDDAGACQKSLGIAAFMKMSYNGIDLNPLQKQIEQEIAKKSS